MKEGKEDMPLVGKTMAEGHTHRMAVLCEKLGSTLREILDGTCPQPAKPENAPKRPALEKYRETYLTPALGARRHGAVFQTSGSRHFRQA